MNLWHALTCSIERFGIARTIAGGRFDQAADRIEAYVDSTLERLGVRRG